MRRIIAISVAGVENNSGTQCNFVTVVLCNDGSVFEMRDNHDDWHEYPPIPQPNNENIKNVEPEIPLSAYESYNRQHWR